MEQFRPSQEMDPSLPTFHFQEEERKAMKERGMTDEQIEEKEIEVRNRLAQKKLEEELDQAA